MRGSKILLIDGDPHLRATLRDPLSEAGYDLSEAGTAEFALERLRADTFHVVLCGLELPDRHGLALLRSLRDACPATSLVLMTGHGTIRSAVTALKRGAVEYLVKPIKTRRLLALCDRLTADPPPFLPNHLRVGEHAEAVSLEGLRTRAPAMQRVLESVSAASATLAPVLIRGETGTGKGLLARAIHRCSTRARGPFAVFRAATCPPALAAAELLGTERGPGHVERAEGGTLFIDEVSALDGRAQVGLAGILDGGRFTRLGARRVRAADVRVIATSSRDLDPLVASGRLDEALLRRLSAIDLRMPALRDRPEDVAPLTAELARDLAARYGRPSYSLPAETLRLLAAYAWPGNVRELRNVLEQAVLVARGPSLDPSLLPQRLQRGPTGEELIKIHVGTPIEAVEREVILRTLEACRGNKTAAADALGISRRSIYNKLAGYGL